MPDRRPRLLAFLAVFLVGPLLVGGFLVGIVASGAVNQSLCGASPAVPPGATVPTHTPPTASATPPGDAPGGPGDPGVSAPPASAPPATQAPVDRSGLPAGAAVAGFDRSRLANAVVIASVASQRGLGDRGGYLGILTAIGESGLENIGYGDWETAGVVNPDGSRTTSIGLFQQQDSWGPAEVRLNPAGAAGLFFDRLVGVGGWQSGVPTLVIHAVQGNLDPFHYARFQAQADAVFAYIAPYIGAASLQCTGTSNGVVALPLDPGYVMTDTFGPRSAPTAGASTWHPAYDLVVPAIGCGARIYSLTAGVVVAADNAWLSVRTPTGETIGYLHAAASSYRVGLGDAVAPGQELARVGNEGVSAGCHLDLRIDKTGTIDPAVAALPGFERSGGPGPFVNPALYVELHGLVLCDAACLGGYGRGESAELPAA